MYRLLPQQHQVALGDLGHLVAREGANDVLVFVRYVDGLPLSERAGWRAWADHNFCENALGRAQMAFKEKLLTSRPADGRTSASASFFLPTSGSAVLQQHRSRYIVALAERSSNLTSNPKKVHPTAGNPSFRAGARAPGVRHVRPGPSVEGPSFSDVTAARLARLVEM